jgi:hypothetical protein
MEEYTCFPDALSAILNILFSLEVHLLKLKRAATFLTKLQMPYSIVINYHPSFFVNRGLCLFIQQCYQYSDCTALTGMMISE